MMMRSGQMRKRMKLLSPVRITGLLLLIGLLFAQSQNFYPIEFMRVKAFDMMQRLEPREVLNRPVTIVDLDEESLAEVGQWPWPRTVIADMVVNLFRMGAGVVAFDMAFPEADRLSPRMISQNVSGLDEALKAELDKLPSNDAYFANVIKQTRVILGQAGYDRALEVEGGLAPVKKSVAFLGEKPHQFLPAIPSLVRNLPEFEQVAAGHGFFSLFPEPDGVVRRVPTLFKHQDKIYTGLSVETLRVAAGRPTILARSTPNGVKAVTIMKGLSLPTDKVGRLRLKKFAAS